MLLSNRVPRVILRLLLFCFTALFDWLAKFAPLSQPMRSKPNKLSPVALVFPRFTRIDVSVGSNSDWFIVLFTFAVIGVKTLNRKPF